MKNFKKNKAFTLSETLIVITVLGIIAAIIVPSIIQKIQDRQTVTIVKKTFSMLDNAFQQMFIAEGGPAAWTDIPNPQSTWNMDNANYIGEKLSFYLPVIKYCGREANCFKYNENTFKTLSLGPTYSSNYTEAAATIAGKMVLKNGATVAVNSSCAPQLYGTRTDCSDGDLGLGDIRVDINGEKGPNRVGYDVFYFFFNVHGLSLGPTRYIRGKYCDKTLDTDSMAGRSCANWIIKHGNMDYKYRDIQSEW